MSYTATLIVTTLLHGQPQVQSDDQKVLVFEATDVNNEMIGLLKDRTLINEHPDGKFSIDKMTLEKYLKQNQRIDIELVNGALRGSPTTSWDTD